MVWLYKCNNLRCYIPCGLSRILGGRLAVFSLTLFAVTRSLNLFALPVTKGGSDNAMPIGACGARSAPPTLPFAARCGIAFPELVRCETRSCCRRLPAQAARLASHMVL